MVTTLEEIAVCSDQNQAKAKQPLIVLKGSGDQQANTTTGMSDTDKEESSSAGAAAGPASGEKESQDASSNESDGGGANTTKEEEKKEEKAAKSEGKSEEPPKKKHENWPLKNIADPHDHDVLYGRGGGTNHHPGNKRYRKMVEEKKLDYVNSKRLDKPLVALEIIKAWRDQDPPGRFLKLDEKTGQWYDVGDKKAREKTSQALREKAPQIRKQIEEESRLAEGEGESKTTRFAEGTKETSGGVRKPGLERDTSLGPLAAEKEVNLEGFSWQDGIGTEAGPSRPGGPGGGPAAHPPPPPPAGHPHQYPPYPPPPGAPGGPPPPPIGHHYRYGSNGSIGSMGPPPPGAFAPSASGGDDRRMQFITGSGRFESWGSLPGHALAHPVPPAPIHSAGPIQSAGSWGAPEHGMTSREHSLGQYPLPHASIGHPAPYATFDGRSTSGPYGPYPPHPGAPPPPPPPGYGGPPGYPYPSGGPMPSSPSQYRPPPQQPPAFGTGHSRTPSNSHTLDPAVASAWSGKPESEIVKTLSGEEFDPQSKSPRSGLSNAKPEIIKRATSNNNETNETKPDHRLGGSVKRSALNRDSSRASNRLKEICFPDQFKNGKFDVAREVNELSEDMGRSRLSGSETSSVAPVTISEDDRTSTFDYLPPIKDTEPELPPAAPRPEALEEGGRTPTIDLIAMDLAVKPKALGTASRSSTIEGLALDAVDDVLQRPEGMERTTTLDFVMDDLQKPGTIGFDDRLTTTDFMQIVNEPIPDDDPAVFSGKRQAV